MSKTLDVRVKNKYGTKSKWDGSANIALEGELIIDAATETNGPRIRIGDGRTAVKDLPAIFQLETVDYDDLENPDYSDEYLSTRVLSGNAGKQLKREVAQASTISVTNSFIRVDEIGAWGNADKSIVLLVSLSCGETVIININGTGTSTTATATRLCNMSKISKIYYNENSNSVHIQIPTYSGIDATVAVLSNSKNDYTPKLTLQGTKPNTSIEVQIYEFSAGGTKTEVGNDAVPLYLKGSSIYDKDNNSIVNNEVLSRAISDFVSANDLEGILEDYALASDLEGYALSSDLDGYATTGSLANYATTSSLDNYLLKSGGTMSGDIAMGSNSITLNGSALTSGGTAAAPVLKFAAKDIAYTNQIPTTTEEWTFTVVDQQGNTSEVTKKVYIG